MKLIVHNDDFGLNYGFSEAILDCHRNGVTTSTSVRVNGTAYKATLKDLRNQKRLGVGLHLNLTDGKEFNKSFVGYLIDYLFWNKEKEKKITKDLEQQFIQAIKIDKLKIDHVNGHDHIHMIPPIFELTAKLCKKYKIKYLRLVRENYYLTGDLLTDIKPFINTNILKLILLNLLAKTNVKYLKKYNLKTVPFYGLLHTNEMITIAFLGALDNAKKDSFAIIEILSHPVYKSKKDKKYTSKFIKKYSERKTRLVEANILKSKLLSNYIKNNKIKLINFKDL